MKAGLSLLVLSLALSAGASPLYLSNFDATLGDINSDVSGRDGWLISDTSEQFSFVADWMGRKAIGLGDASAVDSPPTGSRVTLAKGIGAMVGATSFSLDFALIDSTADFGPFLNRDRFGFSFFEAGSELFSIILAPQDPSPVDPDDNSENEGLGALWAFFYSVKGGDEIPLRLGVFEDTSYSFNLQFRGSSDPTLTDFNFLVKGSNLLGGGAVGIPIDPGARYDSFGIFGSRLGAMTTVRT